MNQEKTTEKPVILCVDNDVKSLNFLYEKLKSKFSDQYLYEIVSSGEDALKRMEEHNKKNDRIILVISDQNIPDINGDKLLAKIHASYSKPIKILITSQASLQSVVNAINNADLYRYLPKPWETEDLLLTVQKAIEQYHLREETQKHLSSFRRFVPPQLANYLGKEDILQVKLGDCVQQEMNILLCDIHAFTSLSEKMTPQENFRFINDYLKYVEPAVKSQEGFVENYIGDAVSALFHEPHQALEASIRIQQAITQFNTQQHLHVTSGIALHTGSIMLGIVGGMKRMQGMVLSKAILSTFTIQEITSLCQCPIIASEEILNNLQKPEKTDKRFLGYIFQKETNKLMKIHEILHESLENMHSKRKTKHVFENGVKQFFANAFEKAIASFKEVSQEDPKDQAAQLYYKAAKQFLGKQLPQQWNTLQLAEHASSNA